MNINDQLTALKRSTLIFPFCVVHLFLAVLLFLSNRQMARYSDAVSPLTDLAVVYGTEGFQMGFGFATIAMPQVVAGAHGID